MDLGGKIRRARLEAELSQRQLCGEEITRNMLSLIENGSAKPSMKTLGYLAEKLGKPLSWFLDENGDDNAALVTSAANLRRAREALTDGKDVFAEELLKNVTAPELQREKLLLSARIPGVSAAEIVKSLPSLDEELLLRAKAALEAGEGARCGQLLEAAEDQAAPEWNLLMGILYVQKKSWEAASICLERSEKTHPEAVPLLEQCFRELGDFKRAYEYACKGRDLP